MKKILLIGNRGYIGSSMEKRLGISHSLDCVDICWFNTPNEKTIVTDYNNLNKEYLSKYDVIILLAGHSSIKMCEGSIVNSHNNNVRNFLNLISKINKKTKFIYASSSSVYGVHEDEIKEEYTNFVPHNNYDITKHIIDLYVDRFDIEYYGLRFGTVNGHSEFLRKDLMINSMYCDSKNNNEIRLYFKDIMRPILGMDDLLNSIDVIISSTEDNRGLYNLSSFNRTVEEIAVEVSEILSVPINEIKMNEKVRLKTYDFRLNTDKFQSTYNFKFTDTVESIVKGIQSTPYVENVRTIIYKYE
jgi:nucleoside-diphosphate-sugar epimerase